MSKRVVIENKQAVDELYTKVQLTKDKYTWQVRFWINDGQNMCYHIEEFIEDIYKVSEDSVQIRFKNRNGLLILKPNYKYYKCLNTVDENWYVVELGNGNEIEIELL